MTITKKTYDLFVKYGSELLWVDDPKRNPRPKGTNKETDQEFVILERLDENLELFHTDSYSTQLKEECSTMIESLRTKVSAEVFALIEAQYINS